jgi:hypothetical protein
VGVLQPRSPPSTRTLESQDSSTSELGPKLEALRCARSVTLVSERSLELWDLLRQIPGGRGQPQGLLLVASSTHCPEGPEFGGISNRALAGQVTSPRSPRPRLWTRPWASVAPTMLQPPRSRWTVRKPAWRPATRPLRAQQARAFPHAGQPSRPGSAPVPAGGDITRLLRSARGAGGRTRNPLKTE